MELKESLKQFILAELVHNKEHANLSFSDELLQSGIIDSLGMMKIIAFIEEKLSVEINDEDFSPENFASIDAIAAMVQHKLS